MLCSSCGEQIETGKEITNSDVYYGSNFGATAVDNSIVCKPCWLKKKNWQEIVNWSILIITVLLLLACLRIWGNGGQW